jgi:hypothetical protein
VLSSLLSTPVGELSCSIAAGGLASASTPLCLVSPCPLCHQSTVDRASLALYHTPWTESTIFLYEKNSLFWFNGESCKEVSGLLVINLWSMVFAKRSQVFKNNSKEVPIPRKIYKIAPETSNNHIFPTTTPNSVFLMPKFLESLPLSLFGFIVHMFVAFIYCLCLLVVGSVVSEPFIDDFQEHVFDEQGKCPLTILHL